MPSPGKQFFSDEFGDIEDYFVSDYQLIDQYIGDQLFGVGLNASGNLGINNASTISIRSTPVTTFAGGTNWRQVDMGSGGNIVAAIKTDGTLWTWGSSQYGGLGINNTGSRITPVTTFSGGTNWNSVCAAADSMAAIKKDGTLWTWGANALSALGINLSGISNGRTTPVTTFAGGNNWKQVSIKADHVLATKTDGTLWSWGWNAYGQLGVNDTTNRNTPVTTFLGGNNWMKVYAGGNFSAAIKTDGTLWTWGRNAYGALGINNTTQRNTPVTTFSGGTNWKSLACGNFHTAAIKTNGTLWVWGDNLRGQVGVNNTTDRLTPVTTLLGGTNWAKIDCGVSQTSAIKTDGTLWAWGLNSGANLGVNDGTNRLTPVTTFRGGNNWKSVACGDRNMMILTSGINVDLS